jgi:Cu(I)/Ag(I) efflux system membrane fusion protein
MATIYSPDLISAQEELIQALKFKDNIQNSTYGTAQKTAIDTVKASREKLSLLGLSSEQITKIETTRASNKIIDINSPIQGIVIEKTAEEGMYVKTGTRIYTVADLSFVWVKLDAYESDLALIKYGDIVEFSTETYPGKTFEGQVDFIDPVVTQSSQTIKVRVSVPNESLELKPGMFVNAIVKSQIDGSSTLAPLIIPVTAAMKTGTRAIVYVEVQKKKPTYEGREITLGPKVGNFYIVKGGLKEGERVVTRGNFKLDAEMQIRAKPSMMSEDKDTMTDMQNEQHEEISNKTEQSEQMDAIPEKFSSQLNKVLQSYFAIQKAMVNDDSKDVSKATQLAVESLKSVDMTLLDHKTHMLWMKNADALSMTLQMLSKQSTLVKQRELLPRLTDEMLQVVQQFSVGQANIYKASCPMAFDNKGASWLQDSDKIQNPYFGNVMQTCGSIDEVIQENISGESE